MSRSMLLAAVLALLATVAPVAAAAPVTAVVTAYQPEWDALLPLVADQKGEDAGGVHFVRGAVAGAPILLVESGIGPVNAALATQIAIDRFQAQRIVVVGIAGGVDPKLHVGDVAVPARWSEYLFSIFARSTPGGYELPDFATNKTEHYEMIFPQAVPVGAVPDEVTPARWLEVDPGLLGVAREAADRAKLERCRSQGQCLAHPPRIALGGNGVSGSAFVDNAGLRQFIDTTFHAQAVDMESAAVAHVASANKVPFIAFRSLSDLAGGGADPNEMKVFQTLAARNATSVFAAFMARLHEKDGAR